MDKAVNHSSATRPLAPLRGRKQVVVGGGWLGGPEGDSTFLLRQKKKRRRPLFKQGSRLPEGGGASASHCAQTVEAGVPALMQHEATRCLPVRLCWRCTIPINNELNGPLNGQRASRGACEQRRLAAAEVFAETVALGVVFLRNRTAPKTFRGTLTQVVSSSISERRKALHLQGPFWHLMD